MGLVQIGVKVEISVKNRILALVNEGKYRDMTDFAVKAIQEKLEREESCINPEEKIQELLRELDLTKEYLKQNMEDFRRTNEEIDSRLRKLENR